MVDYSRSSCPAFPLLHTAVPKHGTTGTLINIAWTLSMQGSQYLNFETRVLEACCKGMYVRLATPELQPHFKDAIIHLSSRSSSG